MKPSKPARQTSRPRPKLPRISEETRRLSALLETELLGWPDVTSRPMFGLNGLYRGRKIFAVLPQTRAMDSADSIAFRLTRHSKQTEARLNHDKRIIPFAPEAKWISFVIESEADIHDALRWLEFAYRQAGKP